MSGRPRRTVRRAAAEAVPDPPDRDAVIPDPPNRDPPPDPPVLDPQHLLQIILDQQQQQKVQQETLQQQQHVLIQLAQNLTDSQGTSHPPASAGPPAIKGLTTPKLASPESLCIPSYRDWRQRFEDYYRAQQLHAQPLETQHGILRSALDPEWTILWTSQRLEITTTTPISDILNLMEAYLRQRRNPLLDRQEFHRRDQQPGESIDRYYAALKILDDASAHDADLLCSTCTHELSGYCTHCKGPSTPLTNRLADTRIRDRFICGLRNKEMQRRILAEHHDTPLSLQRVLTLCSAFEISSNTGATLGTSSSSYEANAVRTNQSSYKKLKRAHHPTPSTAASTPETCEHCGLAYHARSKCPASGQICRSCKFRGHYQHMCRHPQNGVQHQPQASSTQPSTSARASTSTRPPRTGPSAYKAQANACYTIGTGFITIPATIEGKSLSISILPDTGAELDGMGIDYLKELAPDIIPKFTPDTADANAAYGQSLGIIGSVRATLTYNGRVHSTVFQIYRDLQTPLLSKRSCIAIGLLPHDWPNTVVTPTPPMLKISRGLIQVLPPSSTPSPDISELRAQIISEHREAFEDNVLRPMHGPPMKIELMEGAQPCKRYRAYTVPYHWRDQVQEQLASMVSKGIIEPVPVGEPIDWCHPMVVVPKKNTSEPRITVDLTGLNKYVRRPAYPVRVPKEVIARLPPGMKYFTTLDARHGYWQVALDADSRKLTTFITPWGCFRYCRNVMGLISAGDEHNHRGDEALQGIPNVEKIVEDILIYDSNLEEHIQRVRTVIQRCQEHGITLHAKKFVFASSEVDYCGFRLTPEGFYPAPHLTDALQMFPVPTSKTDVRSFLGLAQQFESFSSNITTLSQPIRTLLSSKAAFIWEEPQQTSFNDLIKELISPRVLTHFDPSRPLRLETDAAQSKGLGFALWQQEPDSTWRLLQANSRHVTPTESRYSATEIEMLAVVWAAKKCRLFLLGKPFDLIVDHRPLIPIINSKTLDEVDDPRLQRFKEKLTPYLPHAIWRAGTKHTVVDVFSRYPVRDPEPEDILGELDGDPTPVLRAAMIDHTDGSRIVTDPLIAGIRDAGQQDSVYTRLRHTILEGFPPKHLLDDDLCPYWKLRDSLSIDSDLIYFGSRLVIPQSHRSAILKTLHQSHQGQTRTLRRAQQAVFWPGISNDIRNMVKTCLACATHLPSQAKEPLLSDAPAPHPFHTVAVDLFSYAGYEYLVMVDRYSGWIHVSRCGSKANTSNIIHLLKNWLINTGIPVKLISDNGPQFSSLEFANWTTKWGIQHDTSSPHYPQSNGLAESAVKAIKQLLMKASPTGDLHKEEFQLGLLELRNTPRDHGKSPAEMIFGAPIRSTLPLHRSKFLNEWKTKAAELDKRAEKLQEKARERYDANSHSLPRLSKGNIVLIQNFQSNQWDTPAEIIEVHNRGRSYTARTESGRVFRRNRRFLRPWTGETNLLSSDDTRDTQGVTPMQRPKRQRRVPVRFLNHNRRNQGFRLTKGHEVYRSSPHHSEMPQQSQVSHETSAAQKGLSEAREKHCWLGNANVLLFKGSPSIID